MTTKTIQAATFEEACSFVIKLDTKAHGYGVSSLRLESYLSSVTEALRFGGAFMVTPSSINFIFWRQGETQQFSHFAKMSAPTFDMTKLAEVSELVQQFDVESSNLAEAENCLDAINHQLPRYHWWLVAVGYALSGAGLTSPSAGFDKYCLIGTTIIGNHIHDARPPADLHRRMIYDDRHCTADCARFHFATIDNRRVRNQI